MMGPYDIKAGEKFWIDIEIDYEHRDMPRDASVVVWGFDGPVKLVHDRGIPSQSFPTLPAVNDD